MSGANNRVAVELKGLRCHAVAYRHGLSVNQVGASRDHNGSTGSARWGDKYQGASRASRIALDAEVGDIRVLVILVPEEQRVVRQVTWCRGRRVDGQI